MRDWHGLSALLLDALGDDVARLRRPIFFFVSEPPRGQNEDSVVIGMLGDPEAFPSWAAPPECLAVGLVASGREVSLSQSKQRSSAATTGRRTGSVKLVCLVTREGDAHSKLVTSSGRVIDEAPTSGEMLERLRQCWHPATTGAQATEGPR